MSERVSEEEEDDEDNTSLVSNNNNSGSVTAAMATSSSVMSDSIDLEVNPAQGERNNLLIFGFLKF